MSQCCILHLFFNPTCFALVRRYSAQNHISQENISSPKKVWEAAFWTAVILRSPSLVEAAKSRLSRLEKKKSVEVGDGVPRVGGSSLILSQLSPKIVKFEKLGQNFWPCFLIFYSKKKKKTATILQREPFWELFAPMANESLWRNQRAPTYSVHMCLCSDSLSILFSVDYCTWNGFCKLLFLLRLSFWLN